MQLSSIQYQAIMEAIEQYRDNLDPLAIDMDSDYHNDEKKKAISEVEDMIIGFNIPT
mgnify:CR=1 FL=1